MIKRKHIMLLLEWYDYRIHRGVAQVAREAGWQLNCPKDPVTNDGYLKDWKGDGCIALLQCRETLQYFRTHKIPLVDLGLGEHNLPIPRVVTDNREIGRLAAEHFRDHGYREVFALGPGNIRMYQERLDALREFMEEDGGSVTVLQSSENMQPGVIREMEQIAKKRGNRLEELSLGFFAYQDNMAAELISLCLRNELRVPENMAVLGVDNDDLVNAGLTVGLSSIETDQEGLGRLAANTLRGLLEQPARKAEATVIRHAPAEVVVRRSTDCYAVRNPLVSDALHWIQNNFHTGIQATDVAEAMGVTQQGLQKAFAANYSRSPGQEIRYQRIQSVAHLLSCTTATLEDIAENCGYYSVDTLINSFKTEYGTTPGKYRKMKQQERDR
ncbi:Xylose operon regulatory protein [Pontiella desulfatans]|uniref:Xylose operon regulatory protein n=1 Tax=Pontiella desulfatans TaxID=2750659 RepID=A0A6C2UD52_PONDE|nr:substrate-binding domain-containing protein [Pontiella desulfatans]VGO17487.1 Xylose operon regulatory protein [Pontiella desulfatans]